MKASLGWGFLLWLIGYGHWLDHHAGRNHHYSLGVMEKNSWIIASILFSGRGVWTAIAIICDYFFFVKSFKPIDGYYKLDVYLYYALTFALPLVVGWKKTKITHL